MEGRGSLTFSNGAQYTGDFKSCKRHGTGTMIDGDARYSGEWTDDRRNGRGTM